MKILLRFGLLPALLAASLWSQVLPQGPDFYPGELIGIQTCVTTYVYEQGILVWIYPAVGVDVTFNQPVVTPTSGYHVHENTVGNPPRPKGDWVPPGINGIVIGTTGQDGCVIEKFQTANYSAFINFTSTVGQPSGGSYTTGYTNDLKYHSSVSGDLMPYPDNTQINQAQSTYHDVGHTDLTRYLNAGTSEQVEAASQSYLTTTQSVQGLIVDRLDVYRGSLPWGGISDNEVYGADIWTTRPMESHEWGSEIDIRNPEAKQQGLYAYAIHALTFAGCITGRFSQYGGAELADSTTYWMTQDPVHIVCTNSGHGTSAGHGNPVNHGR